MSLSLRRWSVFNLVGMGGFVLQVGTIALLTRWLGWPSLIATVAGLEIAAFHNFIGHNQFTWKEYPPRSGREWIRRYLRYQVAKTTTLGASLALTMIVNAITPLPLEIANTIAVVLCALPNYVLTERLVFSVARALTSQSANSRPAVLSSTRRHSSGEP